METTAQAETQGLKTLEATEEEKDPKPKEGMIAFTGLQQFTKAEAIKWLKVEEENAREIGRDCDGRGISGAYLAQVRADACATMQKVVRKDEEKRTYDLDAELGAIQNNRLIKEGQLVRPEPNITQSQADFQGISGHEE